ncbi:MAG: hypothetical protein PHO02_04615 [Candidatus Nanoarchaeia archaeon]|nr:hypothetical protein [Candidatus Nanoarchaeia archaeon]
MAHWRDEVKPEIKKEFERLVTKSAQHKETYEKAKQGAIAQLWTANAIQEKELDELRAKIALLDSRISTIPSLKSANIDSMALKQVLMRLEFLEKKLENASLQNEKTQILCKHPDIKREKGYLYFISKEGKLARVPMARGKESKIHRQEILHDCKIHTEPGWLYYVDRNMNSARTKMERKMPGAVVKIPKKYAKDLRKAMGEIRKIEKMKKKITDIEERLKGKLPLFEKAIKVLAAKGKMAEQAVMKTKFLEKALAEISGKRKKEGIKIDANKAMREVISRKVAGVKRKAKKEIADKVKEAVDETTHELHQALNKI